MASLERQRQFTLGNSFFYRVPKLPIRGKGFALRMDKFMPWALFLDRYAAKKLCKHFAVNPNLGFFLGFLAKESLKYFVSHRAISMKSPLFAFTRRPSQLLLGGMILTVPPAGCV
ncbi:hypothetical protein D3C84_875680 [compost metagenome]